MADFNYWSSLLRAQGYQVTGTYGGCIYVDGHRPELAQYGDVQLIESGFGNGNPETEIKIYVSPPETFLG